MSKILDYIANNSVYEAIEYLRTSDSAEVFLENDAGKRWVVKKSTGTSIIYNSNDKAGILTKLGRAFQFVCLFLFSTSFRISSERAFKKLEDAKQQVKASASKVQSASHKIL